MIRREYFDDLGVMYLVVDAHELRGASRPQAGRLERVPRHQLRGIFESVSRKEPALLARLHHALTPEHVTAGASRCRAPTIGSDPRLEGVLRAFGVACGSDPVEAGSDLARLWLLRRTESGRSSGTRQQTAESRRIGEALAKLGRAQLIHRGGDYWLVQASGERLPDRKGYETLSEAELLSFLREQVADPTAPEQRQDACKELLDAAEAERAKTGQTTLLLLRRQRWYGRAVEEQARPLTPSQLRKERHWIEVLVVDKAEKNLPDLQLEVELADGSQKSLRTNADGIVRLDGIPPGNATIRLPQLDGKVWKPLGGAGASPSQKPQPKRVHQFRQGDNLARIAWRSGFEGWKALWESPKNTALREQRKRANMVRPGDSVNIEVEVREIVRASNALHRIQVLREEKPPLDWSC